MHPLFKIAELTGAQSGFIALLAFIPSVIIQIAKVIAENIKKSKQKQNQPNSSKDISLLIK